MLNTIPEPLRRISSNRTFLIGAAVVVAAAVLLTISRQSAGPVGSSGLGAQSLLVLTILAFAGGFVSFISPCTLPILPAYFAFASQSGRSRIALNTVFFMLGVATVFSLLGASASALGRLLTQNQQLLLLVGGSIVMVFGIMSLLGKGFSGVNRESGQAPASGAGGSYAFGLTFSLGWSSCVGPILAIVLTLAASTGSVTRGIFLLFIYTLGLGLPLIIVSTFFGRSSRNSLMWRALRGKGWTTETHTFVAALPWALGAGVVLGMIVKYAYDTIPYFAGHSFTPLHWAVLLALSLAGAGLWAWSESGSRRTALELHSTQLFSGVLFIFMAVLMLSGTLAKFNALIPADLAVWFSGIEEVLLNLFS